MTETNCESKKVDALGNLFQRTACYFFLTWRELRENFIDGGTSIAERERSEMEMDQPANLTANDSGRRRLPWQALQRVADMYWVIHSRYESDPESSKVYVREFKIP